MFPKNLKNIREEHYFLALKAMEDSASNSLYNLVNMAKARGLEFIDIKFYASIFKTTGEEILLQGTELTTTGDSPTILMMDDHLENDHFESLVSTVRVDPREVTKLESSVYGLVKIITEHQTLTLDPCCLKSVNVDSMDVKFNVLYNFHMPYLFQPSIDVIVDTYSYYSVVRESYKCRSEATVTLQ